MAKRKSKVAQRSDTGRKRKRRSDEELIQDLQTKISQIRERQSTRHLRESPQIKAAVQALKAIDKALESASEVSDNALRHVLVDTRTPLATHLEEQGYQVPRARRPRGRRPRAERPEE